MKSSITSLLGALNSETGNCFLVDATTPGQCLAIFNRKSGAHRRAVVVGSDLIDVDRVDIAPIAIGNNLHCDHNFSMLHLSLMFSHMNKFPLTWKLQLRTFG